MSSNRKLPWLPMALGSCLLVAMVLALGVGAANIPPGDVVRILWERMILGSKEVLDPMGLIVMKIRLPRILLAVIIGMALSGSGVVFQAVFQNPMADPYVLGVSTGAAFGAALVMVMGAAVSVPFFSTVTVGAFLGALATSFAVWHLSKVGGRTQVMALLLSGIALNFLMSAGISMLMVFNREQVERIVFWTMGSLATADWAQVFVLIGPVLAGGVLFRVLGRDMNLMLMGEDVAQSLGVNVEKLRVLLLVMASVLTAASVSVSGSIGFIGLVVPHAVRLIVGPDHRRLVPLTILAGGLFLLLADTLARTVAAPAEIPLGAITALTGAPYFLVLLQRSRRRSLGR